MDVNFILIADVLRSYNEIDHFSRQTNAKINIQFLAKPTKRDKKNYSWEKNLFIPLFNKLGIDKVTK